MVEIGKYNKLKVVSEINAGVYLDAEDFGELLLPIVQAPINYKIGDFMEVFIYYNSEQEIIVTTQKPYATVGEFAYLKVVDVLPIGAFLDWGLPKDLFVPIGEQEENMEVGEYYVVYIYNDEKRRRLAASSKLENFLNDDPACFKENDKVSLLISKATDLGYKAIINNSHLGLLYQDEIFAALKCGQKVDGYIKKIRDDKKIDLILQQPGYKKMDELESKILDAIIKNDGELRVTDKTNPEIIYKMFEVSKKRYKMALGSLYKAKLIVISPDVIKIKK